MSYCDLLLPREVKDLHDDGDHGHCHGEPCQASPAERCHVCLIVLPHADVKTAHAHGATR